MMLRSFIEMARSNALQIIARVQYVLRWPFSGVQKPCDARNLLRPSVNAKSQTSSADPIPARIRLSDLFPKLLG
jgi:hypothetical protein